MSNDSPQATLDARYSGEDVPATPWPDVTARLEKAELFWVTSIRPDGRPHVTPVVGVWLEGALYFSSGPDEQKSRNLAANRRCAVTTGCNAWNEGFDIVLHGEAVVTRDVPLLRRVAATFATKYGSFWAFDVGDDGTFRHPGVALVYRLAPEEALGFGKSPFSHTRYDFGATADPVSQ